jgi:AmmeMemoRadiSam system protein A
VRLTPAQRALLLQIARAGVREGLRVSPANTPPPSDPELTAPGGCFVTLHERGTHRLRGCVGRLEAPIPLWQVVHETAQDVLHDPRFAEDRVVLEEIPSLEVEVSVLSPPHLAASPLEFDLLNDGVYLVCEGRSGFFLPQVARDTGWTKEQLLERLCQEKLGVARTCWQRADAKLYTFKVDVIGPEPV